MLQKPYVRALITGALLGVVCIIGAQLRATQPLPTSYLIAFWFNRVLMGAFIGFFPVPKKASSALIVSAALGLFVSLSFYLATDFHDLIGFLVGAPYGMIIAVAMRPKHYRMIS